MAFSLLCSYFPVSNMSIDKFGRRSFINSKVIRGPKGEGFTLTKHGNYDIKNKKLTNVSEPTELLDAVNLLTLKQFEGKCLTIEDGNVCDAKDAHITKIAPPKNDGDAVNLKYLNSHCLVQNLDSKEFDARSGRITNLSMPISIYDAINYKFLRNCLSDLSYAIFSRLHKHSKKKVNKAYWKSKLVSGDFEWEDLFNLDNFVEEVNSLGKNTD